MNFSLHLDKELLAGLRDAVARTGLTRNRIIGEAVREWLARNGQPHWPASLAEHFRNPAPELSEELIDGQRWQDATPADAPRW